MRPQEGVKFEIAGIVDENRIIRLDQKATGKVKRLRTGLRQYEPVRPNLDTVERHAAGQNLPQRREPERRDRAWRRMSHHIKAGALCIAGAKRFAR